MPSLKTQLVSMYHQLYFLPPLSCFHAHLLALSHELYLYIYLNHTTHNHAHLVYISPTHIHTPHTYTPTRTKLRTRGAAQFSWHTRTRRQREGSREPGSNCNPPPPPQADSPTSPPVPPPATHLLHNPSPQVDQVLSRWLLVQLSNGFACLLQGLDGHLPLLLYRRSLGGSLAWARLEPPTTSRLALQECAASATQHTPKAAASTCAVRIVSVNKPLPCQSASE